MHQKTVCVQMICHFRLSYLILKYISILNLKWSLSLFTSWATASSKIGVASWENSQVYYKVSLNIILPDNFQNEQPQWAFLHKVYLLNFQGWMVQAQVDRYALANPSKIIPQATESFPHWIWEFLFGIHSLQDTSRHQIHADLNKNFKGVTLSTNNKENTKYT